MRGSTEGGTGGDFHPVLLLVGTPVCPYYSGQIVVHSPPLCLYCSSAEILFRPPPPICRFSHYAPRRHFAVFPSATPEGVCMSATAPLVIVAFEPSRLGLDTM